MNKLNRNGVSAMVAKFKCSRNTDSEKFLRNASLAFDLKDISRTYLAIDLDKEEIKGYFTLGMKCLDAGKLDVGSEVSEYMNINKDGIAQAYLIGQRARADDAAPGLGKMMLHESLKIFSGVKEKIGCRMVRLDCRDELIGYYRSQGFQHIRKNTDKDLNQMVRFI